MKRRALFILILCLFVSVLRAPYSNAMQSNLHFLIQNESRTNTFKETLYSRKMTFTFDKDSLEQKQKQNQYYFELPECTSSVIPGMPSFPVYKKKIRLQQTENVTYVEVKNVTGLSLKTQSVCLVTTPEPKKIEQKTIMGTEYAKPYRIDEWGEEKEVKRVCSGAFSEMYPTVNVTYKTAEIEGEKYIYLSVNPMYIYEGIIYLATSIQVEIGFCAEEEGVRPDEISNSAVIISPDEFQKPAEKLAEIQRLAGYDSSVVLLSELSDYAMAEPPSLSIKGYSPETAKGFLQKYNYELSAKIRSYLEEKLEQDEIDYLTILGDAVWVPPSFYYYANENSWVDTCVPTDVFYVSPFGIQGDFSFEISVGRLPVRTLQEAMKQVEKIQRYRNEVAKNETWMHTASFFGGDPFDGNYFGELMLSNTVNKGYYDGWNIQKCYQTESLCTKEKCLEEITSGNNGIISVYGHGSGNELLMTSKTISANDLLTLPKQSKLPIFISPACMNGTWDSRLIDGEEQKPTVSFSEAMILSEGAGIAYIGGARTNYSIVNVEYTNGIPVLENYTFMDSILQYVSQGIGKGDTALGDCIREALYEYYTNDITVDREGKIYNPDVKTFFGLTLLGDPTLTTLSPNDNSASTVPKIDREVKPVKETPDFFPVFSIDEGIKLNVASDSSVGFVYASYEKKENGLIDKGVLEEKEENQYGMDFQNLEKTKGCIRFETEDGKEERIVFEAKYNIDVSVQSSPCLHLLRPKEKKRNSVIVQNNGILNTGPIVIQAKVNDDVVRTMEMQDIPYLCSVHFDYEVQPEQEGTLNIYVSAVLSDEKEICLQDNEEFIQLHCTEEPVYRVGLLTGYMFDTSFGDKYMSLQKLNQEFEKAGQNIEIQTISCYYNENDEVSFDTMGFDALILLDCLWFNNQYYAEPFYTILSRFVDNGGKLFGINSLDYIPLQNWAWTEGMQPLFGIRSDVGVAPYLTQYPLAELTFSGDSFLEKNSYKLWNSTGIRPSIKKDNEWFQVDWSEEFLLPGAKIVASSDQTGLSLLQYKENVFLYTGYFHNMCFEKEPDTFQFFSDMLQYLSEPFSDPSIKGVTIDKPDTIRKGDELQVSVEIKNNGNNTTSPIELKYDNGKTMEVDKLYGKSAQIIEIAINAEKEGENTIDFFIQSPNDDCTTNNDFSLTYFVQSCFPSEIPMFEMQNNAEKITTETIEKLECINLQPTTTIFSYDYTENLFIIDYKVTEEGIYLATPSGIHLYKEEQLLETIPYPKEWYSEYYEQLFPSYRSMLEVGDKYIVINMEYSLYIMDRQTKEFVGRINMWEADKLLAMRRNFDWIRDVRIHNSLLYIADSYCVNVYDLETGSQLYREYFPNKSDMIFFQNYILSASGGDISVFNKENYQLTFVEIDIDNASRLRQISDTQAYVLKWSTIRNKETKKWESIYKYAIVDLTDIIHSSELILTSDDFCAADACFSKIAKWQYFSKQSYVMLLDSYQNTDGRMTSSNLLCIFDSNCQMVRKLFTEKTDPEVRSKNDTLVPEQVYFVSDTCRYASKSSYRHGRYGGYDLKDEATNSYKHLLPEYIKDRRIEVVSNITLQKGKISFLYREKKDFGCVQYDLTGDWESVATPEFIPLEKDGYYYRGQLSSTESFFTVYENTHQSIIWYNKETGSIQSRFYLQEVEEGIFAGRFPVTISEMTGSGNTIYMLDYWNQCIYVCTDKGFQETIQLQRFFPYAECKNMVVEGDTIYLLHTGSSCIGVFKEGVFWKWIQPAQVGADIINFFDVHNHKILVNDLYQGKAFVQNIENCF